MLPLGTVCRRPDGLSGTTSLLGQFKRFCLRPWGACVANSGNLQKWVRTVQLSHEVSQWKLPWLSLSLVVTVFGKRYAMSDDQILIQSLLKVERPRAMQPPKRSRRFSCSLWCSCRLAQGCGDSCPNTGEDEVDKGDLCGSWTCLSCLCDAVLSATEGKQKTKQNHFALALGRCYT